MSAPRAGRPRVFISYAQFSDAHSQRVLALAQTLVSQGIDAELDQFHQHELLDWPRWCQEQLRSDRSDWVLMVCSAAYRERVENRVDPRTGQGAFWEGALIDDEIYGAKENRRFVPVLLDDEPQESIPGFVRGWTFCRVRRLEMADPGYERLYRLLTRQPGVVKAPFGPVVALPSGRGERAQAHGAASVSTPARPAGGSANPQPPSPKRPRAGRRWFWRATLVVVLWSAGVGGWYPYRDDTLDALVHQGVDDRHYESARAADTEAAYRGYLSACAADGCGHRAQVEQWLDELAESARLAADARAAELHKAADDRAFAAVRTANTDAAYRDYLGACNADGCGHRAEAERQLAGLAAVARERLRDVADFAAAAGKDTADAYRTYLADCAAKGCTKRDEAQASLERIAKRFAPAMVLIPAGSFSMGCQPPERGCSDDENPAHQVQVAAFELGKTEVTYDEWDACVADGGCTQTPADEGWGRGKRPVIGVSWDDTQQYLAWLSRKTGKTYRLPTEAEWEYAARAGANPSSAFSSGDCIKTDQANYGSNYGNYADCGTETGVYLGKTQPVGSYPANPWGLYDLHGNVEEWVQDCWHDNYAGAPQDGSAWLVSCGDSGRRVLRGGSWNDGPWALRSANRGRFGPDVRSHFLGFRVARTLTP